MVPIAMSLEEGEWHVDVSVKRPRITEYELHGQSPELIEALRSVYRGMSRWRSLEKNPLL